MTTITLPRAVVEQALEALEMCRLNGSQYLYGNERDLVFSAIKALRAALAQQAEPVLQGPVRIKPGSYTLGATWVGGGGGSGGVGAPPQQAEQAWVCPDSPEHRYAKPGHCEDCGKTLVQEQGCDHCNHPLYAATRCRVCGRVTEQAEPVEPVAWRTFDGEGGYDYRTYEDSENYAAEWAHRNPRHVGWVEPLYLAPPQRKPLTDEEIDAEWRELDGEVSSMFMRVLRKFARAIERAHGINHSKPE